MQLNSPITFPDNKLCDLQENDADIVREYNTVNDKTRANTHSYSILTLSVATQTDRSFARMHTESPFVWNTAGDACTYFAWLQLWGEHLCESFCAVTAVLLCKIPMVSATAVAMSVVKLYCNCTSLSWRIQTPKLSQDIHHTHFITTQLCKIVKIKTLYNFRV